MQAPSEGDPNPDLGREWPWFLPLACGAVQRPLAPASPPTSRLCYTCAPKCSTGPQKASAEDLCFQPTAFGYPISVAGTTFYPARPFGTVQRTPSHPFATHPTIPSVLAPGPLNLFCLCLLPALGPHGPSHAATGAVHLAPKPYVSTQVKHAGKRDWKTWGHEAESAGAALCVPAPSPWY